MSARAVTRPVELPSSTWKTLAVAVLVASAAHVGHLPLWASALVPAAVGLRLALGRPPGRWLLLPLVIGAFAAVLLQFRSISGATAGGSLFSAMLALKFLESRSERDAGLVACLAYFHATSVFLTSQSIGMAAYVLVSLGVTTFALTTIAAPTGPPTRLRIRYALLLLVQAVPIMLVLFVLFPRIPGPLWGIGDDESAGRTGLSDRMSPGSITNLVGSDEVAFRVQFEDDPPAPGRRYWRGPVFWAYDGRTWSRGEASLGRAANEPPRATGEPVDYILILEPHQRRWLFGLDMPLARDSGARRQAGYNLVLPDRVRTVQRHELRSVLDYRIEPELPAARRERALQLPAEAAPRARRLAQRWKAQAGDPRGVVDRALQHFRQAPFAYTLSPPALGDRPVDQFLFETRSGFCEHYASAFTVLMRAAGIPARVVTGYLGGETNELGDYMIVRQSDAHAWAEVWLDGQGWVRVDPTGAVSSDRIERGVASVSGASSRLATLSRPDAGWIRSVALAWDSINHGWNRLVLGYGPRLQERLLDELGLQAIGRYALAGMAVAAAALLVAAVWLVSIRPRPERDPGLRAWQRARRKLRRAGVDSGPGDGPQALAERVRHERPDLYPAFRPIAREFIALRYQGLEPQAATRRLRKAVSRFRPGRRDRRAQAGSEAGTDPDAPKR